MSKAETRREAPLPPATNRGVLRSNKAEPYQKRENLTVMIDWCQITVKNVTPELIANDILKIPYWLMSNDFRRGIAGGYNSLMCFDDIRVLEPSGGNKDNGYQILMSGKGCRNYEKFLEANEETWYDFFERAFHYNVNFPRIDLAIDDYKTYFKIAKLARLAKENMIVTRLRVCDSHVGFNLGNQKKRGDTLYIGSGASEFYMCFYEKGYEQTEKYGASLDDNWNRYELRFRQKRAVNLAKALVQRRDVATVAMEVLNESVRFVKKPEHSTDKEIRRYPLWEPWAWFMHEVAKLKLTMRPEEKDYFARLQWLRNAVAPTLKVYLKIDEILKTNAVQQIIEEAKLDKRHMQMITDYVNQLRAQEELFKDDLAYSKAAIKAQKAGFITCGPQVPFDESEANTAERCQW